MPAVAVARVQASHGAPIQRIFPFARICLLQLSVFTTTAGLSTKGAQNVSFFSVFPLLFSVYDQLSIEHWQETSTAVDTIRLSKSISSLGTSCTKLGFDHYLEHYKPCLPKVKPRRELVYVVQPT